jgi:calcium/calmodulin-dependent protein kinase I
LKDPEADDGSFRNLLPSVRRNFDAKGTWKSAFTKVRAANQFKNMDAEARKIKAEVDAAQASAKAEQIPVSLSELT